MKSKHPSLIKYFLLIFSFFTFFGFSEEKESDDGFVRELYRDLNIFDRLEDESRPKMINAREAENPFSHLVNLPIQYNSFRNAGPHSDVQNVINIKPQIPFILNDDWYVLTKTDLTITSQGARNAEGDRNYGFGDLVLTTWFSPINDKHWAWGFGPAISLPTSSNSSVGTKMWSLGPSASVAYIDDTWLVGAAFTNIWSVAGRGDREVNLMSILPVLSYNLTPTNYLVSAPTVTSNWRLDGEKWTVPLGGGFGHLVKFDRHVVNFSIQAYYNVIHPDDDDEWSTRLQIQYFFPKKRKAFFEAE